METVRLMALSRKETGKGVARRLRRAGKLPAVLYGHGMSTVLAVDDKELWNIRQSEAGANTIIDLVIGDDNPETCSAILREVQIDPVSRAQVHADFYRIAMDEVLTVSVPLEFVNAPEDRLKASQAMLTFLLRDIEVQCLPQDIPDVIAVDLQALQIGEALHANALELPPGVTLVTDAEETVVTTTASVVTEAGEVATEVPEDREAGAEEGTSTD